jgi:hypothetical protein
MKKRPNFATSITAALLFAISTCSISLRSDDADVAMAFRNGLATAAVKAESAGAATTTVAASKDAIMTNPLNSDSNASDWTARDVPPGSWNSVAYGNGSFVAVGGLSSSGGGNLGLTLVSSNGIDWKSAPTPSSAVYLSVAYGNGIFVAVGANKAMTSPDGIDWTTRPIYAGSWKSVAYGKDLFVAVNENTYNANKVATSPDGVAWTVREAPKGRWRSVTYGNGLFVAVRDDSYSTSTDRVMTSPDGINWTSCEAVAGRCKTVAFGNGLFVAAGDDTDSSGRGFIMTSPDGVDWTTRSTPVYKPWNGVAYGNGLFVAVGEDGFAMTSPDGFNWTAKYGPAGSWRSVAAGNDLFVAVGRGSGTGDCVMTYAP